MDRQLKEAIETYERNIKSGELFYMDAATLVDIESHYEKQGKEYEAEQCLRFAKQLHPDSEDVLIAEAYRLKMRNKWKEGLDIMHALANQLNPEVQLFYIEWNVMGGNVNEAMDIYRRNLKLQPSETELCNLMLDTGEVLTDYGFTQRAIDILSQIPATYGEYRHALELLADNYFQSGQFDNAQDAAQKMVDLNPYDAYSWAQLADVQQKAGRFEPAYESCEYALAIDPDLQPAKSLKVYCMLHLGNVKAALELVEEYKKDMPEDYTMHMYAGGKLFELLKFKEALPYFQYALARCPYSAPDRPNIILDLAVSLAVTGHREEGVELYKTTLPQTNDLLRFYWRLFEINYQCKQKDEALDVMRIIVKKKVETYPVFDDVYDVLAEHDLYLEAKDIWQELFQEFTPSDPTGKYEIIRLKAATMLQDVDAYMKSFMDLNTQFPFQAAQIIASMEQSGHKLPRRQDGKLDYQAIQLALEDAWGVTLS